MVFILPSAGKEVTDRMKTDVQSSLPETNPFFRDSWLGSIIAALGLRVFDFYLQLKILIRQIFPDTAEGEFLQRWGSYKSITRNPATRSSGLIVATGTAVTNIPLGTQYQTQEGIQFLTTASSDIISNTISVASITRSGNVATATLASAGQAIASGIGVTIAGANEVEYNGLYEIMVTGDDTFTYEVSGTPASPATGTITMTASTANVSVESIEFGQDQNVVAATAMTLSSPIAGVDNIAYVKFSAIGGGTDLEADNELRIRVIDAYQNPISLFNVSAIRKKALEVSGNTRIFIESPETDLQSIPVTSINRVGDIAVVVTGINHNLEDGMYTTIVGANESGYNIKKKIIVLSDNSYAFVALGSPATPATGTITALPTIPAGQVYIYFTRDNDDNIIPDASEITNTKNKILEIKPAHVASSDVIVRAPVAVIVNFVFTALSPNSTTMQAAVKANIEALFRDATNVGESLKANAYNSAIYQTVDPETGLRVDDFTLSSPSGTVSVLSGQLPILGNISFP